MELIPKIIVNDMTSDVTDVYFDLTLIVDKQNNLTVIDNQEKDWTDFVDCDTLIAHQIKLRT